MKSIAILGAGGFGREVFEYATEAGESVAGFVDRNPRALDGFSLAARVLGSVESIADVQDYSWVIALGDAVARADAHAYLAAKGATFRRIIHPTAYVSAKADLGPGCVIAPFAAVAAYAVLGNGVVLNTYASVGHDSRVGDHCVLSPYAALNGNVLLGHSVLLGSHAVVTPGRTVGSGSKVAVGAAVTRDVPPGSLVVGNPAKGRVMFHVHDQA